MGPRKKLLFVCKTMLLLFPPPVLFLQQSEKLTIFIKNITISTHFHIEGLNYFILIRGNPSNHNSYIIIVVDVIIATCSADLQCYGWLTTTAVTQR